MITELLSHIALFIFVWSGSLHFLDIPNEQGHDNKAVKKIKPNFQLMRDPD